MLKNVFFTGKCNVRQDKMLMGNINFWKRTHVLQCRNFICLEQMESEFQERTHCLHCKKLLSLDRVGCEFQERTHCLKRVGFEI